MLFQFLWPRNFSYLRCVLFELKNFFAWAFAAEYLLAHKMRLLSSDLDPRNALVFLWLKNNCNINKFFIVASYSIHARHVLVYISNLPGTRFLSRSLISASILLKSLFFLYARCLSFSRFDLVNFAVVVRVLARSGKIDTCRPRGPASLLLLGVASSDILKSFLIESIYVLR